MKTAIKILEKEILRTEAAVAGAMSVKGVKDEDLAYLQEELEELHSAVDLLEKHPTPELKESNRAAQLADFIRNKFKIDLEPKIRRRYKNNDQIKFEMVSRTGQVFYFKGCVKDFLSRGTNVWVQIDTREFSYY